MLVKIFDEAHEKDLEKVVNTFLATGIEVFDIKYSVSVAANGEDQIYCFTAMIIYNKVSD